jgi:hypothetical protein
MMMANRPLRLPDDVEQFLIDGQRTLAMMELMERRGITFCGAQTLIGRWLFEWQQADARPGKTCWRGLAQRTRRP